MRECRCSTCILALWECAHEQLSLPSFPRPAALGRGCASPTEAARPPPAHRCQLPAPNSLCVVPVSKVRPATSFGAAADTVAAPEEPGVGSQTSVVTALWCSLFDAAMSMFKRKKSSEPQFYATVADGLKKIYKGKLLPLEEVESDIHADGFNQM